MYPAVAGPRSRHALSPEPNTFDWYLNLSVKSGGQRLMSETLPVSHSFHPAKQTMTLLKDRL